MTYNPHPLNKVKSAPGLGLKQSEKKLLDTKPIPKGSTVKVQYQMDSETKEKFFRVGVMSKRKPGLMSFLTIPHDAGEIGKAVQLAAGAVAEDQNEKYGDNHNPSECARAAADAFNEVVRNLDKAGSSNAIGQYAAKSI